MAAVPSGIPLFQAFTPADGTPLAGGKVWTYLAGTTSLLSTWAEADQATINANPVILDANGQAPIFLSGTYKFAVYDALDNLVWELDGIKAQESSGLDFDVQVDDLAARAAYDNQNAGFRVLVSNIGGGFAAIYSKNSSTAGDWSAPAMVTGPQATIEIGTVSTLTPGSPATVTNIGTDANAILDFGIPQGAAATIVVNSTATLAPGSPATVVNVGSSAAASFNFGIPAGQGYRDRNAYSGAVTNYVPYDVVTDNGSSWLNILASAGGNAPPVLPTTSNTWWQLFARKGTDGVGTGDVTGPGSSVDGNVASFDGTTGKLIEDSLLPVAKIATTGKAIAMALVFGG